MRCNIVRYCKVQKSSNINHNITEKDTITKTKARVREDGKENESNAMFALGKEKKTGR